MYFVNKDHFYYITLLILAVELFLIIQFRSFDTVSNMHTVAVIIFHDGTFTQHHNASLAVQGK